MTLVAVAALLAMRLLPALLKPPEPPPLAADVGLPKVAIEVQPERTPQSRAPRSASRERKRVERRRAPSRRRGRLGAAIAAKPKADRREKVAAGPASASGPAPVAVPAPVPEPPPPA
ncbi:MAG: hypothetical protein WA862_05170, partial [Solirubrobacterales bacterium]